GDPEDDVAASEMSREIRLREATAGRIRAAGDGEEVVHAAVRRVVVLDLEARLAHRAAGADERRHDIRRAAVLCHRYLGIGDGARPAGRGVRVAPGAAVEIEAWPEAARDVDTLAEALAANVEQRHLGGRESGQRRPDAGRPRARPRIFRDDTRGRARTAGEHDHDHQADGHAEHTRLPAASVLPAVADTT